MIRHALALLAGAFTAFASPQFFIAPFTADVTVPLGHGMMGGLWKSKSIADPLYAKGVVLIGGDKPVVFVSVDWCEIRNASFDRWREVLARAAGTTRARVLVSAIHQHEAPVTDLEAQRILERADLKGSICDLAFHEKAVQRTATALRAALKSKQPVTHLGLGQAKVEKIASNRRYVLPDGKISFSRGSASGRNVLAANAPEGTIDPWLKTISFWNGNKPLAALSGYATHPMSYYRTGEVSADFPGLARARRQKETPGCLQVYFSGASGNVTAGKYNTGERKNRAVLANRLHAAMAQAWKNTERQPLKQIHFRNSQLRLKPRNHPGFTAADFEKKLTKGANPWHQCLAAMGLSWRQRCERGQPVDVPAIDFGSAQLLLLPGESYVEYQLAAQKMRPNSFVLVAGYGEGGTGYIPTEKHWAEKDSNLGDWCWVHPGAEKLMFEAIRKILR
ncbi:MAG: hypothetical protein VX705_08775 [Verrucomicrobiota bacterium]|nr:hypothetical protein [Verrucomicrobiota bacterium]